MKPKKSLSQNFLKDKNILTKIVEYGNLNSDDVVLEIGPGTGNLTQEILEKSPQKVIVVEKDKELANFLKKKFGNSLSVINGNILDCIENFKFDIPIKVFGNLPYNISTQILISLIKLDSLDKYFKKFIFLFQKEVADRIIAQENSKYYGRLSILTAWKMDGQRKFDISPDYFYPKPKVWSSVVTLSPKLNYEKIKNLKNFEHITNIFFNKRRKMIRKPMIQLFKNYEEISEKLNLDLNLRPQNISKDKYIEICKKYEELAQ